MTLRGCYPSSHFPTEVPKSFWSKAAACSLALQSVCSQRRAEPGAGLAAAAITVTLFLSSRSARPRGPVKGVSSPESAAFTQNSTSLTPEMHVFIQPRPRHWALPALSGAKGPSSLAPFQGLCTC